MALPALSRATHAQAYPSRPVRIIVGFAAGGGADTLTRLMGEWLSQRLGQPFITESRPCAGTNIAADAVVQAAADRYTLLYISPASAINATLYQNLSFDFLNDIVPIARIGHHQAVVMVLNPLVLPRRDLQHLQCCATATSLDLYSCYQAPYRDFNRGASL